MKKHLKWILPVILAFAVLFSLIQILHDQHILKRERTRALIFAENFMNEVLDGNTEILELMQTYDEWSDDQKNIHHAKLIGIADEAKRSGVDETASVELLEFSPMQQADEAVWFFIATIQLSDVQGIRVNGVLIPDQEEKFISFLAYWNDENHVEYQMGKDLDWTY